MAPEGSGLRSLTVGIGLIVSGMVAVPTAPDGSVTEMLGVKLPEAECVPPNVPLMGSIDIPGGRLVADQAGAPESPTAETLAPGYGRFTVEAFRLEVVILGAITRVKLFESESGGVDVSAT
jgi:hypothetical protein